MALLLFPSSCLHVVSNLEIQTKRVLLQDEELY